MMLFISNLSKAYFSEFSTILATPAVPLIIPMSFKVINY